MGWFALAACWISAEELQSWNQQPAADEQQGSTATATDIGSDSGILDTSDTGSEIINGSCLSNQEFICYTISGDGASLPFEQLCEQAEHVYEPNVSCLDVGLSYFAECSLDINWRGFQWVQTLYYEDAFWQDMASVREHCNQSFISESECSCMLYGAEYDDD